jgi:Kef-type K+ transport system membrane component KefB
MHDLFSLGIIWLAVLVAHWAAGKTKLTPVVWFLAVGCILVNLGVLPEKPGVFILDLADVGIIVIMFALGFEENSEAFLRSIRRSWGIALFGALAPFAIAYSTVLMFWDDKGAALLCGLAMTATAVSLTMVTLRSEGLHKTPAATGIMTSAVLDDIASLALVAILVPLATGEAMLSVSGILLIAGKAIAFFALITLIAVWLFPVKGGIVGRVPGLGNYNLRSLITMQDGEHATLTVLLIALWVALLGHEFGFHPAVGAYMAGLILKEEYFLLSAGGGKDLNAYDQTRRIIDSVAFSWIGPVFFIVLGTNLILDWDILKSVAGETIVLFLGLFFGQILSAGLAARFTGGFDWPDSWLIGFGMLGRAELAFVVMNIAFVQHQVINEEMFYTLMATAFCLNVSVPLTIRGWKRWQLNRVAVDSP